MKGDDQRALKRAATAVRLHYEADQYSHLGFALRDLAGSTAPTSGSVHGGGARFPVFRSCCTPTELVALTPGASWTRDRSGRGQILADIDGDCQAASDGAAQGIGGRQRWERLGFLPSAGGREEWRLSCTNVRGSGRSKGIDDDARVGLQQRAGESASVPYRSR